MRRRPIFPEHSWVRTLHPRSLALLLAFAGILLVAILAVHSYSPAIRLPSPAVEGWRLAPWLATAVVFITFCLFAWSRITADLVAVLGLSLLLLLGVLSPREAFAGFSNEGVITIGALYVVVAGLRETGAVSWIGRRLLGRPGSLAGAQIRVMVPIAFLSAFLNNTPLVAMMLPAVSDWAKRNEVSPSKVMIPLSYAAVLGGACTLVGTSTNLVVAGLLKAHDGPGLGLFEIALVGVPCAVVGIAYVLLTSRWLLPDRRAAIPSQEYGRTYTTDMTVDPKGPLVGKTIELAGLRHLPGLYLAHVERDGRILPAVSPTLPLRGGDRLGFVGAVESVVDLNRIRGLLPAGEQLVGPGMPRGRRLLVEAVLSDRSPLVGGSIRDRRFRTRYGAVVVAVARGGERLRGKIGNIVLRPGDTLLLEAPPSFAEEHRHSSDFYLLSPVPDSNPYRHDRAWIAVGILTAMVASASLGWLTMLQAALLAALCMIAFGCAGRSAAGRSIDGTVLIVIAASFALGRALEVTGVAGEIAKQVAAAVGGNPRLSLLAIYLVTALFTELISNNGAAVLMFPLAAALAESLGVSILPYAVAIMMAASFGFASPIGYQTHLMVYGPGGYRFGDYFRIGLPLDLLMALLVASLAPVFWPF